jgi:hypothetical protein
MMAIGASCFLRPRAVEIRQTVIQLRSTAFLQSTITGLDSSQFVLSANNLADLDNDRLLFMGLSAPLGNPE